MRLSIRLPNQRRVMTVLAMVAMAVVTVGYITVMRGCSEQQHVPMSDMIQSMEHSWSRTYPDTVRLRHKSITNQLKERNAALKTVAMSTAVNTTWALLRQNMLSDKHRIVKVLILAYMRSGSSLFYRLFDDNSTAHVSWFEPLDSFYATYFGLASPNIPLSVLYHTNLTRRLPSEDERSEITDHLYKTLTNDVDHLPLDLLSSWLLSQSITLSPIRECVRNRTSSWYIIGCTSELVKVCGLRVYRPNLTVSIQKKCPQIIKALNSLNPSVTDDLETVKRAVESLVGHEVRDLQTFLDHHRCLKRMDEPIRSCWAEAKPRLKKATMVVAKLIRWSFVDLEALIQRMPDIHIIHYVRDPRAVTLSRNQTMPQLIWHKDNWTLPDEAEALCARMRDDIITKPVIEGKYPGALLTVRYEDFVGNIPWTVDQVFRHIGRPTTANAYEHVRTMSERKTPSGRVKAAEVVGKWKSLVSYEEAVLMNRYCSDVLEHFRYTL